MIQATEFSRKANNRICFFAAVIVMVLIIFFAFQRVPPNFIPVVGQTDINTKTRKPMVWLIEGGSNDGAWIAGAWENRCITSNSNGMDCKVAFFEPQPRFESILQHLSDKINKVAEERHLAWNIEAYFFRNAVWNRNETMKFSVHSESKGIGSSLLNGSVYQNFGARTLLEVQSIDFAAFMKENCIAEDNIFMRFDIEGAEYIVIRHMINQGVACWVNRLDFEGHAMYTQQNQNMRVIDVMLPWLLRDCGVEVAIDTWYNPYGHKDPRVIKAWPDNEEENKCKMCKLLYIPIPETLRITN